jgi:hypothetical protein
MNYGTIDLVEENGQWKVAKQSWIQPALPGPVERVVAERSEPSH